MLVQTLVTSGIINRFISLSVDTLQLLSAITWGGAVAAAALFAADVIEDGKLDPGHRRLLRLSVLWVGLVTPFYLFAGGPLRALVPPLYYLSYVPVLALFAWTMTVAFRRGSRAVRFQIAAWLPIMITGSVRIASSLGATETPLDLQFQQHLSIALEVIITSLGVADRFMLIRRQRDRARAEARLFEDLAERDPLTGLLNRRWIEARYEALHAAGYQSMAVLDIDLFKRINDAHGHLVGDAVLRAAADALSPDDDTIVVRLGGEEFLLLLRGSDIAGRAERRRRAIAVRVSAAVPGLHQIVTASMGLVERTDTANARADFAATLFALRQPALRCQARRPQPHDERAGPQLCSAGARNRRLTGLAHFACSRRSGWPFRLRKAGPSGKYRVRSKAHVQAHQAIPRSGGMLVLAPLACRSLPRRHR